jgi:hypothetical protein
MIRTLRLRSTLHKVNVFDLHFCWHHLTSVVWHTARGDAVVHDSCVHDCAAVYDLAQDGQLVRSSETPSSAAAAASDSESGPSDNLPTAESLLNAKKGQVTSC